jgi:hypothetical protein
MKKKNQGNVAFPNVHNSLATDSKDMEVDKMREKEPKEILKQFYTQKNIDNHEYIRKNKSH